MWKAILFCLLAMCSASALALGATTKGKYFSCRSEQWLGDFGSFSVAKDYESMKAYIASKKCMQLKAGLSVTVTDSPGVFGSRARFVVQGIKFWAPREELNYGN